MHSPCNRYFLTLLAISTIASHEIPGQQRVADMLSFRVARCFGRSSHDHCDDLVHHSTISAAARSGTGISVSWDGHSIAGAGPDRLAYGVVWPRAPQTPHRRGRMHQGRITVMRWTPLMVPIFLRPTPLPPSVAHTPRTGLLIFHGASPISWKNSKDRFY